MFWLLFLPVRLAFGLIVLFPFFLLRFVLKVAVGLIMMPLVAISFVFGLVITVVVVSLAALLVPILPLALLALLIVWAVVCAAAAAVRAVVSS